MIQAMKGTRARRVGKRRRCVARWPSAPLADGTGNMQREQACIRVTNVMQDGKLRSGESIQRRESFAIGDDEASGVCDPRLPGNSAVASDAKTLFQRLSPDGRQRRHTEEASQRGGVGVPVEHKTEH